LGIGGLQLAGVASSKRIEEWAVRITLHMKYYLTRSIRVLRLTSGHLVKLARSWVHQLTLSPPSGGIFFTMLTGQPPFSARFESDVVRQVRKVQWWNSTEQLHSLPLPIINLLRSIFTADPLKRATMLDIRKQLRQIESLSKAKMLQPADTQIPGSPPLLHVVTTKGGSKKKRKRAPPTRSARSNLRPIIEE